MKFMSVKENSNQRNMIPLKNITSMKFMSVKENSNHRNMLQLNNITYMNFKSFNENSNQSNMVPLNNITSMNHWITLLLWILWQSMRIPTKEIWYHWITFLLRNVCQYIRIQTIWTLQAGKDVHFLDTIPVNGHFIQNGVYITVINKNILDFIFFIMVQILFILKPNLSL